MNKLTAIELLAFLSELLKKNNVEWLKIRNMRVAEIILDDESNTVQLMTGEVPLQLQQIMMLMKSLTNEENQRSVRYGESSVRSEITPIGNDVCLVTEEDWTPAWGTMTGEVLNAHLTDIREPSKSYPIHIQERVVTGARITGGRLILRTMEPDTSTEFLTPPVLRKFLGIYMTTVRMMPVFTESERQIIGASDKSGRVVLESKDVDNV